MIDKDFIPSIMDIEASGFGSISYPIEIGVVTDAGKRLCYLIYPHSSWHHWDCQAEKIHGIPHDLLLKSGKRIPEVCFALNNLLAGKTVYSDGWSHDIRWLRRLYEFSGMECQFTLSPIESIVTEDQLMIWDQTKVDVLANSNMTRHRASSDALIVQQTFLQSVSSRSAQRRVDIKPTSAS